MSEHERLAACHHYRRVGARMGIYSIPGYAEFERFKRAYEAEHFVFAESNRVAGRGNLELVCGWFPRPLRRAVSRWVIAGLEPEMRRAFGFPELRVRKTRAVSTALRLRGGIERLLSTRPYDNFGRGKKRSYPNGEHLDELGDLDSG